MKKREQKQKKKKVKPDDIEQSARFIETAERIESAENTEEVFKKVVVEIIKRRKRLES